MDAVVEDVSMSLSLVEGEGPHRSVLLNGFETPLKGLLLPDVAAAMGLLGAGGVEPDDLEGVLRDCALAFTEAAARLIAARAAFFRGAETSGARRSCVVDDVGVDFEDDAAEALVVVEVLHRWWVGKRCSGQNCCEHV